MPERRGTAPRRPSLSPSRAADFKTCPLLYRFRTIDRLPERKSLAAVRGTLVHSVLERLYDLPPARAHRRGGPGAARARLGRAARGARRRRAVRGRPRTTARRPTPSAPEAVEAWLASAGKLVEKYFTLEDPTRIQPHGREELVEVTLPDGLLLRGFVDRLDVAPNGALRVVDYKTGAVPREAFEGKALFQMKFYALVLWRTRGVVAAQLKLLYLKDGDALTYAPDEEELHPLRAHPASRSGRPSSGRSRPATSGRTRPGCATGATTRRSARRSAALPRRSPPRPPPPPAGRRCARRRPRLTTRRRRSRDHRQG